MAEHPRLDPTLVSPTEAEQALAKAAFPVPPPTPTGFERLAELQANLARFVRERLPLPSSEEMGEPTVEWPGVGRIGRRDVFNMDLYTYMLHDVVPWADDAANTERAIRAAVFATSIGKEGLRRFNDRRSIPVTVERALAKVDGLTRVVECCLAEACVCLQKVGGRSSVNAYYGMFTFVDTAEMLELPAPHLRFSWKAHEPSAGLGACSSDDEV